jgi:hypothetical protein
MKRRHLSEQLVMTFIDDGGQTVECLDKELEQTLSDLRRDGRRIGALSAVGNAGWSITSWPLPSEHDQ